MGLTIVAKPSEESVEPIVGIDLGTTFSLIAWAREGQVDLVRDDSGDARVPSAIAFAPDGSVTVGWEARRRALGDSEHVAYSVKRLIGKSLAELETELPYIPYQVVERERSDGRRVLHVRIGDREHTPEELSAMVLRELAGRAKEKLGFPIRRVVITVPAYFDESQRQATRDAGRLAGLDVVRIINEPTAAALAYGLGDKKSGRVAVYDFGGGTFDCSILEIEDGVFKVLSTHGDTHLGGDDVDQAIMAWIAEQLPTRPREDATTRQALKEAAEAAKIALTHQPEAAVVWMDPSQPESPSVTLTLTRAAFDDRIAPLVERTIDSCRRALRDAELSPSEVGEVVLVGGSSRIPLVRRRVEAFFGRPPHTELNPDEVVALGAAVQAGILAGQMKNLLLLDITPLSLGLETMGGGVSKLIPRNSTIPIARTERFTTFVDGQTSVELHVVQGERELVCNCRSLGRFKLTNLPPMAAGIPQIDVTFLIDANGMLQVSAVEQRSGQATSIEIRPSQGLSRDEVERMIRESVEFAREDFSTRRMVDLRVKADGELRYTFKALTDAGDDLPEAIREAIEEQIAEVESARQAPDPDQLQRALDALDLATRPLAERMLNRLVSTSITRTDP